MLVGGYADGPMMTDKMLVMGRGGGGMIPGDESRGSLMVSPHTMALLIGQG
jgi:hypothetical protein